MQDLPAPLQTLDSQAKDCLKGVQSIFSKIDKTTDLNRKSRLLDDVTPRLRDVRRFIQEFEEELKTTESHYPPEVVRLLHDRKKSLVKDLNAFVTLRKTYTNALSQGQSVKLAVDGRTAEVSVAPDAPTGGLSNQELISKGTVLMDETDQAVMRSRQVVENTINIGAAAATTLKGQTEQMERIVDNLDSLDFSLKQASKVLRRYGRQVATDKCILILMALLVLSIIAVIVVKIVQPKAAGTPPST